MNVNFDSDPSKKILSIKMLTMVTGELYKNPINLLRGLIRLQEDFVKEKDYQNGFLHDNNLAVF